MKSFETTSHQPSLDERQTADVHVTQIYEESKKRQEKIDFVDHGLSFASQDTDATHREQKSSFALAHLEGTFLHH